MNLDYIDLHCDTALELYRREQPLQTNSLAISLDGAAAYHRYAQFFAIWGSSKRTDEQIYQDFITVSDHFDQLISQNDGICRVRTANELTSTWQNEKVAAILAVEDARLLAGNIKRLDELATRGVKYLTLMWAGEINWKIIVSYYISGLPMDCVHAAATWLFLWFAAEPMLEKLDRIKVKYGLVE